MGTTNLPKFIPPNAIYPAIRQSLSPKFPSIWYFLSQKSNTPNSELRSAEKGPCLETDEWILYCKLANAQGEYHKRYSC